MTYYIGTMPVSDSLQHHGILGMRWGERHGPPYPLDYKAHSQSEKRQNSKRSLSKYSGSDDKVKAARKAAAKTYKSHKTVGEASEQHRKNLDEINAKARSSGEYKRALAIENYTYRKKLHDIESTERGRAIAKKVLIASGTVAVVSLAAYGAYKVHNGKVLAKAAALSAKSAASNIPAVTQRTSSALKNVGKSQTTWLKELEANGHFGGAKLMFDSASGATYAEQNLWSSAQWSALSTAEKQGIKSYTGNHYKFMNRLLRGIPLDRGKLIGVDPNGAQHFAKDYVPLSKAEYQKMVDNCAKGLSHSSLPNDAIAHRGVGSLSSLARTLGVPEAALRDPQKAVQLIGQQYTDDAFGSFGNAVNDAWPGPKIHALIPKGSRAMYVDLISVNHGEHEILTQKASQYIIRDVLMDSKGTVTDIFVQMVTSVVP